MTLKLVFFCLSLFFWSSDVMAQNGNKSSLQSQAEVQKQKGNLVNARAFYVRAYEDYAKKGNVKQSVACGLEAAALYYQGDNLYKEGLDLLRRMDQNIEKNTQGSDRASLHYQTDRERLQIYMKQRKLSEAQEQLSTMERHAEASNDADLKNDLFYNKTLFYYTFGQTEKANATLKEMVDRLTAAKAQKMVAEMESMKEKIAEQEASIDEKDSSLTARQAVIVGLGVLAAILAAALVLGAIVLMRYILLTRKQKKTIQLANETNALKAKFINNISAQLAPTLQKLDSRTPEVKALLDFSDHIQTLSDLENSTEEVEKEDTRLDSFCEGLMEQVRGEEKNRVSLTVNAPKMSAKINQKYVSHILLHLLRNAAIYTPEDGHITLEYKKRGAHKHQFVVTDTGCGIPEEKRENVFKPFLEIRDLTTGDGLGLPTCKQMALKMNGDLDIDPTFTKGTRFVLHLNSEK